MTSESNEKKVGFVISRYYFSDKILDAFSYFLNWDITIIDFQIDDKNRKKRFKEKVSDYRYIDISNLREGVFFFYRNKFDFVLTLHEGIPVLNLVKKIGLIKKLFVFQSANLNSGNEKKAKGNQEYLRRIRKFTFPKLVSFLRNFFQNVLVPLWELKAVRTNNKYYDLYLCWNPSDACYVNDERLRLVESLYHKFLYKRFVPKPFQKNIMIAYQGELGNRSEKEVKRYNEFIQNIIDYFGSEYDIFLKIHPRCKENGEIMFNGDFKIKKGEISYTDLESCSVFIGEDTYLGIEFYFSGSMVYCHGIVDEDTSNQEFNDGWYSNSEYVIKKIEKLPDTWNKLQEEKEIIFKNMFDKANNLKKYIN